MPVSKTKMKNAAIAARMAALPSMPKELIDQFVTGPMSFSPNGSATAATEAPGSAHAARTCALNSALRRRRCFGLTSIDVPLTRWTAWSPSRLQISRWGDWPLTAQWLYQQKSANCEGAIDRPPRDDDWQNKSSESKSELDANGWRGNDDHTAASGQTGCLWTTSETKLEAHSLLDSCNWSSRLIVRFEPSLSICPDHRGGSLCRGRTSRREEIG